MAYVKALWHWANQKLICLAVGVVTAIKLAVSVGLDGANPVPATSFRVGTNVPKPTNLRRDWLWTVFRHRDF
jgi:hypothetical protein